MENCLFRFLAYFKLRDFLVLHAGVGITCIFYMLTSDQICGSKYFFHSVCGLLLCWWFPLRSLLVLCNPTCLLCFCCLFFGWRYQEIIAKTHVIMFFPMFLLVILILGVMFQSLICFEWFLCLWYKKVTFHYFSSIYPVVPNTIYGRNCLSPLCIPGTLVPDHLTVCVCAFLGSLICSSGLYVCM